MPRNLNDSTVVTVLSMMVSGWSAGGILLKSTVISTALSLLSVEQLDWSAERQVLIPAEHFWCDFKCRP